VLTDLQQVNFEHRRFDWQIKTNRFDLHADSEFERAEPVPPFRMNGNVVF
jgi:hypothetical protein